MLTIVKKLLTVILLALITAAPLGCLNINKEPSNEPTKEVNVGGSHGVTVER